MVYSLAFADLFLGNTDEALKLFRSLETEYEAGLFGEAVCHLCAGKFAGKARIGLSLKGSYRSAFEFLRQSGVTGYLDVARAMCAAETFLQ